MENKDVHTNIIDPHVEIGEKRLKPKTLWSKRYQRYFNEYEMQRMYRASFVPCEYCNYWAITWMDMKDPFYRMIAEESWIQGDKWTRMCNECFISQNNIAKWRFDGTRLC